MTKYETAMYEVHVHNDPEFPIIFHYDTRFKFRDDAPFHWHEGVEILFVTHGTCMVSSNSTQFIAGENSFAVLNSSHIHSTASVSDQCSYYCLIISKDLCDELNFPVDQIHFREYLIDPEAQTLYLSIVREMKEKKSYYKTSVKLACMQLLIYLARDFSTPAAALEQEHAAQLMMVRQALSYIHLHYAAPISLDDLCSHVGFSKYYFSRNFKEIIGKTVTDYINFIRCSHAQKHLASGKYNVRQTAELCGFQNLSYFSKTYKKYMGALPSEGRVDFKG